MSLTTYKQKRSFKNTPEPSGGKASGTELRFVVQMHKASRLHYDLRLEMGGVLKSWAVPKGPSTDPKIKRLAMMVEDHPFDYRNFEGNIPKGEYGAGTVIVWDEGPYEALAVDGDAKAQEKYLLKELKKGSVKVKLYGKKLNGEFALVKTKGMAENAWLLIKHNDDYATTADITKKNKSVLTHKTIAQVAREYTKPAEVRNVPEVISAKSPNLTETKFYTTLKPMLATLATAPIDDGDWQYEIKWDGYRAIAFMGDEKIELKSRNNKSFKEKFYPVYDALKNWGINAIVDGEVVVTNQKGTADFGALQNWKSEADGDLTYHVFDLIWYNGNNLKHLPLLERRNLLKELMPKKSLIKFSKDFGDNGTDFFDAAKRIGLEGIIGKRKDGIYETGQRTKNWIKIKASLRQEVVIGGYTKNETSSKLFSALLVGFYEGKKFIYTGKVGTGFTVSQQREMLKSFEPLITEKSPFAATPDVNKPSRFKPAANATAFWLQPKLLCEVTFAEMTADGVMRHPTFVGMRADKKTKDVKLETKTKCSNLVAPKNALNTKSFLEPTANTQTKKIGKTELKFTNLNKIFWPKENITKRDLINYYEQVSPYILPYLKNRPQSLNRHPNGITGKNFYQKDVTGKVPDWIDTYLYHNSESSEDRHFLLGNNEATLLYMIGLGCIEINLWSSTIKKPDFPTWCIIDLDPDKNTFDDVVAAAQVTKQICDDGGIDCYCKTSGSTGLHIYIPMGGKYTYEQSKEFGRIIATLIHRQLPKFTTLERSIADRKGKMYVDFLQNRPQATLAAPYAVRPKPGATVSMPLHWDEVKKGLKMSDFNISNAMERIAAEGDIFKPVLGKGIDLKKAIAHLRDAASQ